MKNCTADELFAQHDSVLAHSDVYSDTIVIKYAKGLKVDYNEDGVHVFICNPDPNAKMKKTEEIVISNPSSRFICTTALQLGNFEALGLEDKIVGMNSLKNLFSPKMKEQIKNGSTVKIGKEGNFDLESVVASKPDYIFVSASKHGGFEVLKDCNIPLISHHGYKETDPLGQAEWIKLIGILTGETRRANAVFADIETKYLKLKDEVAAQKTDKLPTVISGRQIRDGWYFVGGKSYMAQIFSDAGAEYIMKDNSESGGVTEDFESVYVKGLSADFWQTDGAHSGEYTLNDLAAEDERYATMEAFKNKQVVFCNLSETPYRELGGVQPHYILADFVKAFHPELLPTYEPKYYKIIK
ncbi:MAG: ABC transporter substrate-binding protein [Bacteroidales bacterium]|nr:ABC transporter substrate-binding protein [Candidatus Scybalocola fimicaballi]